MTTSLINVPLPTRPHGAGRFQHVLGSANSVRKGFEGARGLAGVLLAAMVSALVVVVAQLINSWSDGHLLAAWVMLWVVGFAALALLAPAAKGLSARLVGRLDAWSRGVARRRADERLWELAHKDPRIMAELEAARSRHEG